MLEYKQPNIATKLGTAYEIPNGMTEKEFYNLVYEFTDLAKIKGLTIRQTQYLFTVCSEYIMENKLI